MATYFKNFPRVEYELSNTEFQTQNITKRFRGLPEVLKNRYIYYIYTVKDGERPDMVAAKYHGDPTYDWIILLINGVFDPQFQWTLNMNDFNKYIINKYGSIETAQQTIKYRQKVINEREEYYAREFSEERFLNVDEDDYNSTPVERRRIITAYDYELDLNEQRRKIKLIDNRFLPQFISEYNIIFSK